MKRRILITLTIIAILVVALMSFTACKNSTDYDVNLLTNSDFEKVNDSGTVTSWTATDTSTVSFPKNTRDDSYDPKLGSYYAKFSVTSKYTYLYQTVTLEKNKSYEIKAYVKVDSVSTSNDIGFRFGFDTAESFVGLNITKDTDGEWETFTYYFTSSVSGDVKLTIGTGNSTNTAVSATAYVDNVSLKKVESIPESFSKDNTIEVLRITDKNTLENGGSITFVILMTIMSLLIACALFIAIKANTTKEGAIVLPKEKKTTKLDEFFGKFMNVDKAKEVLGSNFAIFLYVMVGALLIRFIISVASYGLTSAVTTLESIAKYGSEGGLLSFYSSHTSVTAPVGVSVVYTILGYVANSLGIKSGSLGFAILMRLPMVISEIVTTYMIYAFTAKHKSEKTAAIYSAIYAFVPVFFFFGSFYAATEVIAMAFIVGMMMAILNKDYIVAGATYLGALLFSNYALIILPIIAVFEIWGMVKDKTKILEISLTAAISFIILYVFGMLMTWDSVKDGQVFEYFKRMYQFFKDSAFLSTDSFNMYAVFGAANDKTRSTMIEVFNWLFVAAMSAWPIYLYIKNNNRADLVLNSALMFAAYAVIGAQSTVYVLPFALVLLLIYVIIVPDNRLYLCLSALATLSFMNLAQIASQSGYISAVDGAQYTAFASNSPFLIVFSIFTVIAMFYFAYTCIDISYYDEVSPISPLTGSLKDDAKKLLSQLNPKKLSKKSK